MKPFSYIHQNFLVAQAEDAANNAIMCFHRDHPFLNFTINELVAHFDPFTWGQQGPKRVSECAKQYCVLEQGSEKLEGINCMPKDDKFETGGKFSILHHRSGIHKLLCSTKVMASFNFKKLFCNLVNIETNNCKKEIYLTVEDKA